LDTPDIPISTRIDAVYPNPFNPSTTISYIILKDAVVNISIFNDRGQLVRNINENHKIAGSYKTVWNGMDNYGNTCASGIYYLKMQAGNDVSIHKAVIMK
jgi:flagellar hook assembly protein FlgD